MVGTLSQAAIISGAVAKTFTPTVNLYAMPSHVSKTTLPAGKDATEGESKYVSLRLKSAEMLGLYVVRITVYLNS